MIDRSSLPVVRGEPFQLHQLFENLISNSVKYHKDGIPVHIRISCAEAEVISSQVHPETRYLKISVSDNGIGFEQQYAGKIFEIFQRLHGQMSYSGTGIGLAICKKIAENHGGFIRASGHQGQGATFDVYFPQTMVVRDGECSGD
jgi:signal transduction histidine kinase